MPASGQSTAQEYVALFAVPDVVPFYESLGFSPEPGSYLRRRVDRTAT